MAKVLARLPVAPRLRDARGDIMAGLLLLAGVLFVFRGALKGLIFWENDTIAYYYPVLSELRRALQQGGLPLWTPSIYGGFPLFADGESGALYPINTLLLLLATAEDALLWLGPLSVGMAALFTYLYARTIGMGSLGAAISAVVFSFGGFTVAQLHHLNISNGALWLPLVLLLLEKAYRSEGRARLWAVAGAGVAFAIQSVALHVQVTLMTLMFLVLYLAFRTLAFPAGPLLTRLRLMAGSLAGTIGLGLGLAAVQWLPLYELSRFSPRGPGLPYSQAVEYAVASPNLITLLSPYFFRSPQRVPWGIWSTWETALYVGIAPLLLAVVAVAWARSRWAFFFAATGVLSLWLAMASYVPVNLHYLLYRLPWFDALRAPGRFSYLLTFSVACLAGLGAEWLAGFRGGSRPRRFSLLPFGFLGLLGAILGVLVWLGGWLSANRDAAADILGRSYLGLGPPAVSHLTQWDVYDFLRSSVEPRAWAGPVALALVSCGLLAAWGWVPRLRRSCLVGLALVVAADLFWFAQDFHQTIPVSKLAGATPETAFLAERTGGERVFNVSSTVAAPNRLAPFGIQAAGGYSSLPFRRHRQYAASALVLERPLLELWNVRFLVAGRRPVAFSSYDGLTFNPAVPLFTSSTGSRGPGLRSLLTVPDVQAREVRLLSTLRWAPGIPQGTTVGSLVLGDGSGSQRRIPLVAGVATAEAAYDRGDVRSQVRHERPPVGATLRDVDAGGKAFSSNIYYARMALPEPITVRTVALEYDYPSGGLDVYAVALLGDVGPPYQVPPFGLEKYRRVYESDETIIYEDRDTLPRAFLVPRALSLADGTEVLARLARDDFDPLQEVLLEEPEREPESRAESRESSVGEGGTRTEEQVGVERPGSRASARSPGQAVIREYRDQTVTVQVEAEQPAFLFLGDSYYPGWRAYVDGREARIYRADYLFRAVRVPAGRHLVEFRYQPESFALGVWVSAVTAALLVAMVLAGLTLSRPGSTILHEILSRR